jgi:hypothetical protein
VTPPGTKLLSKIEKDFNFDSTKKKLGNLCESFPQFIVDNMNLAKSLKMKLEGSQVHLEIYDSVFRDLYNVELNLLSVAIFGCPIVSAVACALSKASHKPILIKQQKVSADGLTIRVNYAIIQS